MAWLPEDFVHPTRVDLPTGEHLRPIRESDVDIDMPAVMGSQERLFTIYGEAWGWPPATMTPEQDREDLAHHEQEAEAHLSFNYAVLDADETELLGCVYIDPPEKQGADADVTFWLRGDADHDGLAGELEAFVRSWLAEAWPFGAVRYPGRDLSWAAWNALPDA